MSDTADGAAQTAVPRSVTGTLGEPIAVRSRIDELTDRLVAAVLTSEYVPGSRLPSERDLAASLGAGRMTVRAALARLVDRGLLTTRRGRGGGSFVSELLPIQTPEATEGAPVAGGGLAQQLCQAIDHLHGALAEAAAERRTVDDSAVLQNLLVAFRDSEQGLPAQEAASRIHASIVQIARNDVLRAVLADLGSRLGRMAPPGKGKQQIQMSAGGCAILEHDALIEAVTQGRADDASHIAADHARVNLEAVLRAGSAAKTSSGVGTPSADAF